MSPNRLVSLLTPIAAPVAGLVSAWLLKQGVNIPSTKLAGEIAYGATFLGGMAVTYATKHHWLNGWQAWEQRLDDATNSSLDNALADFLEQVAAKTGVALPGGEPAAVVGEVELGGSTTKPPPVAEPGAFPADERTE